jgi:hypothetical protein
MAALFLVAGAAEARIKYIYVVPTSHWNLGGDFEIWKTYHFFTTPETIKQQYKEHLDQVLAACLKERELCWNIEAVYQFQAWWERTPDPKARQAMLRLMREGRIELGAASHNYRSAFLGGEEVNRACYAGQELRERYGLKLETAIMNDVPGWSWSLVQPLAKSGVRYFVAGANYFMGGQLAIPPKDLPFWWEGPDGSRVLTWVCIGSYTEGMTRVFVDPNGGRFFAGLGVVKRPELREMNNEQVMEAGIGEECERLEKAGYRHDAILIMHAHDGVSPANIVTALNDIRAWNARHEYPKIIVSTAERFFRHLEETSGDRFPVYSGDWAGLWESANTPSPHLRGRLKYVRDHAPALEKLASVNQLLGGFPYPGFGLGRINELMLEHDDQGGGGAAGQVTSSELTKELYLFSLTRFAQQISAGQPAIVVFNPCSWERTDPVVAPVGEETYGTEFTLLDAKSGRAVACEKRPGRELRFVAREVPPLGYKLYLLGAGAKPPGESALRASGNTIENEFYRITADAKTGALTSVRDKELKRELVDQEAAFPFNGLLTSDRALWGALEAAPPGEVSVSASAGEAAATLVIERQGSPFSRSEITLYGGLKRIDLKNWLDCIPTERQAGSYYFSFPFALDRHAFTARIENANAFLSPDTTYLPGAYTGSFIATRAVDLHEGEEWGVAVAQRSTEIVLIDRERPALISKILTEGLTDNYGVVPPPQFIYEYSLTSYSGPFDAARVKRFGEGAAIPFWGVWRPASARGKLSAPELSFLSISAPNVVLSAWKRVEKGEGDEYLLRFQEVAGQEKTRVVVSSWFPLVAAEACDMVERPLAREGLASNPLRFTIGPDETVSVRVRMKSRE